MYVVCVHVHVKDAHVEDFKAACKPNHEGTIAEAGALRFDVLQQLDDPTRFVLYEVYRDEAAAKAHKDTAHYQTWRDTVADWMASPREGVKHASCFPADIDDAW
ncbi:MAG: antibiotic biosynthesis monooxygenase [Myxococcales bacterium]|nr:antibiotic biosynthesis monooxygenase [Myxococcales bacterium]